MHRTFLALGAAVLGAPAALAQISLPAQPLDVPPVYAGTYHVASGTFTPADPGPFQVSLDQPANADAIYNNSCASGFFYDTVANGAPTDEGRIPSTTSPGPVGDADSYVVTSFQLAYATSDLGTVEAVVDFYEQYTPCADPAALVPLASYSIPGLPGSTTGGIVAWIVDIDLTGSEFTIAADGDGMFGSTDTFGYRIGFPTATVAGPLIAGPVPGGCPTGDGTRFQNPGATAASGLGNMDFFYSSSLGGCGFFGGNPYAGFWLVVNNGPFGDTCDDPIAAVVGTQMGTLAGATATGTSSCGLTTSSPDRYYVFTAPCDGTLDVSTCGTHDLPGLDAGVDTVLSLHTGCPADGLNQLACNDDASSFAFGDCGGVDMGTTRDSRIVAPLASGDKVLIRVSNFNNSLADAFVLNVDFACAPTSFCYGDGSGTACPCGNTGAAGNGCAHGANFDGANLAWTGDASVSGDTVELVGTGLPVPNPTFILFFQGDAQENGGDGTAFGDGLRCVSGNVIRLGTKETAAGAASYPGMGDASVSVKGMVPGAGGTFYYQGWFRNVVGPCLTGFNLTNGEAIDWAP